MGLALAASSIPGRLRPRPRRLRVTKWTLLSAGSIVAFIAVWWLADILALVSRRDLPTPLDIVRTYGVLAHHGYAGVSLQDHVFASLRRCALGFAIGAGIGTPLGLLTGYYRTASALVSPIVAVFRPAPPISYLPLIVIFFGIGESPKIILIATGAFFYMLLNTAAGVRAVPRSLIQAGQVLGLSRRQLFTSVIFRAALPQILTGMNVALVLSWAIVVAAELVSSTRGLGFIAVDASTYFIVKDVYAAVILIGIIGAVFEYSIRILERLLVPWVGK